MSSSQEKPRGEITLDLELGGKPLTPEVFKSLSEEQKALLKGIADKNDQMIHLYQDTERASVVLSVPEGDLRNFTERTVTGIISEVAPLKQIRISEAMRDLLMQAINTSLSELALVQRVCQRYDLSDEIWEKIGKPKTQFPTI